MALSADQVYLLNTLTYISKGNIHNAADYSDVGSFVNTLLDSPTLQNQLQDQNLMSVEQIQSVCSQIRNDPVLSEMTIAYADRTAGQADRIIFVTPDHSQAVIALEGTMGAGEWRDDAYGVGVTDAYGSQDGVSTPCQEAEMAWFNDASIQNILSQCDHVTISGHSKGGNKAKYLTLLDQNDVIDECISFDGQGFSDEFILKYANEIHQNQSKITNYNNRGDYVNILLNDVGNTLFIQGQDVSNFLLNHSLFTLHQSIPFSQHQTQQSPLMAEFDRLLNRYLRTLSSEDKVIFGQAFGELLVMTVGAANSFDRVMASVNFGILMGQFGADNIAKFILYVRDYASAEVYEAFLRWLQDTFPDIGSWLDGLIAQQEVSRLNGRDLGISSANLILIDTEQLLTLSTRLNSLCTSLQHCASDVRHCAAMCDDFDIGIKIGLAVSYVFSKSLSGLLDGTPAQVLRGLDHDLRCLGNDVDDLADRLRRAAALYEENEKKLISSMTASTGFTSPWA